MNQVQEVTAELHSIW